MAQPMRAEVCYAYAEDRPIMHKVPAQVTGEELERIRQAGEGELSPEVVVEESRPPEAPLHSVFLWDDERAAELYRRNQARQLITSVRIITPEGPEVRPFWAVARQDSGERNTYRHISEIRGNAAQAQGVLSGLMRHLDAAERAVNDYTRTAGLEGQALTTARGIGRDLGRARKGAERLRPEVEVAEP